MVRQQFSISFNISYGRKKVDVSAHWLHHMTVIWQTKQQQTCFTAYFPKLYYVLNYLGVFHTERMFAFKNAGQLIEKCVYTEKQLEKYFKSWTSFNLNAAFFKCFVMCKYTAKDVKRVCNG